MGNKKYLGYVPKFIDGKVTYLLSRHTCTRAAERFAELGVVFDKEEKYYNLCLNAFESVISNKLVNRYINNLMCYNKETNFVLMDKRNKTVFVVVAKPSYNQVLAKTFYLEALPKYHEKKWGANVRLCWLHQDDVFVFSTRNGNVTWIDD